MTTRANLLLGDDYEGVGEGYCHTLINLMKNHWRMSDPCANLTNIQPGMVVSDEDDDKLYHYTGLSGAPCEEVLQETLSADKVPIFASVELGNNQVRTNSRARIYLSGNQLNLVDTTYTKVLLDATTYDGSAGGGLVDLANNKITVLVSGYYDITGQIGFTDTTANTSYIARIYVDGGAVTLRREHAAYVGPFSVDVNDCLYVASGQDIELYGWNNSGGNLVDIIGDEDQTYLTIRLHSQ